MDAKKRAQNTKIIIKRETPQFSAQECITIEVLHVDKDPTYERVTIGNNPVEALFVLARIMNRCVSNILLQDKHFVCAYGYYQHLTEEEYKQPMTNLGGVDLETGHPICRECPHGCQKFYEEQMQQQKIGGNVEPKSGEQGSEKKKPS